MVYDHSYDLSAVIMVWETMKAVVWSAVSPFPAAQWLPYDFVRREVSLFTTARNICVTFHGFQHCVTHPVITPVFWCPRPPSWESSQAQATAFLDERYSSRTSNPSPIKFFELSSRPSPFLLWLRRQLASFFYLPIKLSVRNPQFIVLSFFLQTLRRLL